MSAMLTYTQLPPLSLYIHIPWCAKKCPYCDFNSHTSNTGLPEQAYIDALIADLDHELPNVWGREIISVFIGGGTPSLFTPQSIDTLLSLLRGRLHLAPNIEITMEANPGTVEQGRFNEFKACGINRLSVGVQSFQAQRLKSLGRIHDEKEACHAIEVAQQAGFDNINIDLMYGLPQQSLADTLHDINTAIALQPQHISHYQLTIEPNTAFHHRPPVLPDDDHIWEMQIECQSNLANAGYNQYEVSAYAQQGKRCQHNLNYWQFGDYLGIGAGAHQKLTLLQTQCIQRRWKQRIPNRYMTATETLQHIEGEETVNEQSVVFEFMLNALRLNNGFDSTLFQQHTGLAINSIKAQLTTAEQQQLIDWSATAIKPSEKGRRFLNELLMIFMP